MQSLRQIGAGLLLSIASVVIVLGGMTLALAEGNSPPVVTEKTPTDEAITAYPTLQLSFTNTSPAPSNPTITALIPPTLANCHPPAGWLPITIQVYDNLNSLAQAYRTTVDLLKTGNCLLNDELVSNSILYVPPQPTATLRPCSAPANWGYYTVLAGDTLYRISLLYRISWQELMQANCLNTSYIKTGQSLRVPYVPTSTAPVITDTSIPVLTETPVDTLTVSPASPTATETFLPTATETPSPTTAPSETPLPSDTPTPGS